MRDSLTTLPDAKTGEPMPDKTTGQAKTYYTATITPRALPSDTLAPFPLSTPAPPSAPTNKGKTPHAKRPRRRHIRVEFVVAVCVVLGVGFIFVPKKWLHHYVPPATSAAGVVDSDDEDFAPGTASETAPTAPLARTPEEWVKTASITGVRKTRILINGKVHRLNEPIPPFRVAWTGKESGVLTFRGANGTEYSRDTK